MMPFSRHVPDRIVAALFVALAAFLLAQSVAYGLFQSGRPGPGLFPGIISAALLVVSAAWFVTGAGAPHDSSIERLASDATGSAGSELDEGSFVEEPIDARGVGRIAIVVAWSAVPLLLLESAGYVIGMTIYVSGLLTFLAGVRVWVSLPATAAAILLTAIGADALGIALPDPLHLLERFGF